MAASFPNRQNRRYGKGMSGKQTAQTGGVAKTKGTAAIKSTKKKGY